MYNMPVTDVDRIFWLFGGYTVNGSMNDLWMYHVTNESWIFVSGDQKGNSLGQYNDIVGTPCSCGFGCI